MNITATTLVVVTSLLAATVAQAQAISAKQLVEPTEFFGVTSSPSGSHVAELRNVRWGPYAYHVTLQVAHWRNGRLQPYISTGLLGRFDSVLNYRWLGDNYLWLQDEDLKNGRLEPVVASLPDGTWRHEGRFTQLLKYPWGDPDHALLQASGDVCRIVPQGSPSFCLFSVSLNHWGGKLVSDPLPLLPVAFLPISPGEIYASGNDLHGDHEEYRLDGSQRWRRVPDGTVARRRAALLDSQAPSGAAMARAAQLGISHPAFVYTAPGHRLVGIIGHVPERAFVSLDPQLDRVQAFLESFYPGARVSLSGLNDSLTRGQLTVWSPDLPPTNFFLQPDGSLLPAAAMDTGLDLREFGQTRLEPAWAQDSAVAVTLPPQGVALLGVVVTPVLSAADALQDPLFTYRPQVQAFAQKGIAVVQVLSPIPHAFLSNSAGALWRANLEAHLQQVVDNASHHLVHGGPVCLYGRRLTAELALAAGGLAHVGCIAAVDPVLNPRTLSRVQDMGLPQGFSGLRFRYMGPSLQMLDQEFPGAFGNRQGQLNDATHWVRRLPASLMLAYDPATYADPTRGYSTGDFADGSRAFRAMARKAGKRVDFYSPDPRFVTFLQREAHRIDAVSQYVHDYFAAARSASIPDDRVRLR